MPVDNPLTNRIVVVGAGQAGLTVCDRLRQAGHTGSLTLVGSESILPYQRPPLSKAYLTHDLNADRLWLKPAEFYQQAAIDLRLGETAVALNRDNRIVHLASGVELPYDRLAITTGALPRRLPAAVGGELPNVFVLRTQADSDAIAAQLGNHKQLLIIGGGYIGLEIAASARKLGTAVTVAEAAPRILARVAGAQTAERITVLHASHGVELCVGLTLETIKSTASGSLIAGFAGEHEITADLVVVGIGALPDITFAQSAGLDTDDGIRVNEFCQTSDPNIFAAGDCTSFPHRDQHIRLESVQNAIDQGDTAARNMLGQAVPYRPVPWFWSDQYDSRLQIAGLWQGANHTVVRPGADDTASSIWYFHDDELLATDAINDPRACMVCRRLLEKGISPSPDVIADPNLNVKTLLSHNPTEGT